MLGGMFYRRRRRFNSAFSAGRNGSGSRNRREFLQHQLRYRVSSSWIGLPLCMPSGITTGSRCGSWLMGSPCLSLLALAPLHRRDCLDGLHHGDVCRSQMGLDFTNYGIIGIREILRIEQHAIRIAVDPVHCHLDRQIHRFNPFENGGGRCLLFRNICGIALVVAMLSHCQPHCILRRSHTALRVPQAEDALRTGNSGIVGKSLGFTGNVAGHSAGWCALAHFFAKTPKDSCARAYSVQMGISLKSAQVRTSMRSAFGCGITLVSGWRVEC